MGAQPLSAAVHEFSDTGNTVKVVFDFAGTQRDLDVHSTADSLQIADKRSQCTRQRDDHTDKARCQHEMAST